MFHDGSLQSGIARAIQEQKLVACFVRDDSSTSLTWENEWLSSGWLSSLLEQKSVLLRIEAGSTEAGFLAAFCPLENPPVFVVIHNGQLQDRITSDISKEEFINRIRKVLGAEPIPGVVLAAAVEMEGATEAQSAVEEEDDQGEQAAPSPPPAVEPVSRQTIPEPARRVAPATSTPPISAKAKGKQKATSSTDSKPSAASSTRAAQQSARDALRKKKQEEKEELARIKARIEADKAERKAQSEARKAEREREKLAQSPDATPSTHSNTRSSKGSQAKEVHLNVRLFDGRNIRKTFPRTANLQDDVRPWIDEEFAANAENPRERLPPYIFKQILAPLPNKEIAMGEEGQELGDIDLAPSATLILIPIKGYTEAYSGNSGGVVGGVVGGVTGLVGGALGLVSSTVGFVGNTLGAVVGYGGSSSQTEEQQGQGRTVGGASSSSAQQSDAASSNSSTSKIKVRTMAEQRAREKKDQQLYNGNQLNFEPRKDDE